MQFFVEAMPINNRRNKYLNGLVIRLLAMKNEVAGARALVKQAGLKANPVLEMNGSKQVNGGDNNVMAAVSLPLDLGGRRSARVAVAERELEIREEAFADKQRLLSAEVRTKFGEALAQVYKPGL